MAKVTLQTIADRVGVSRMTVSNAFSRPDQLSPELRGQILATADELGYAGPDPAARALARGATSSVGVLLTDSLRYAFTDEVATAFLAAIVGELAPTGRALTLLPSHADGDLIPARDAAIDGAIVYSCQPDSEARRWLVRRGLPLVLVDQEPIDGVPCVNVDDLGGARAAAQHLVDLGHRRVVALTLAVQGAESAALPNDRLYAHPQRQRVLGWLEVLAPAAAHLEIVEVTGHDDRAAALAIAPHLAGGDRPTAVLCFSDLFAVGVLHAARDAGLDVPADLSVVGFDDSPSARRVDPLLTTVRQDVEGKGHHAAAMLRRAMSRTAMEADGDHPEHVLLPTELIVRSSTAPAS
jgi:DNA-binding LacI/PurR family transcriptional regulator